MTTAVFEEATTFCPSCGPPWCEECGSTRERHHDPTGRGCWSSHNHPQPTGAAPKTCKFCGSPRVRWNGWGYYCSSCGRRQ
jgi:hypothetical protein